MSKLNNPFEQIRSEYNTFSKKQRAICDCILEEGLEVAFMSANHLAKKSETSAATVVRFTKQLGYSSYLDFTEELHQMITKDYRPMGKLGEAMKSQSATDGGLQQTIVHDSESISSLASLNSEDAVQDTVRRLCDARNIYITGARSAYTIVYYLGFLLRELVDNVHYFPSSADDAYERLEQCNCEDVIVVVSFRRYARTSSRLARFSQNRDMYVIGLTDVPNSPLCQLCDLSLFASNNTPFYSYTAAITLVNTLIWGFASSKGDKLAESLKKRQQMLLEQEIFV